MDNENKIITIMNPNSSYVEAYKKLQMSIQYSSVDKKIQVIAVTSSIAGEGKTSTAVNLAASYVLKEKKVLIVGLDFRKPKLYKALNVANENGITDYLAGNITLDEVVKHHEFGIDCVVRGSKVPNIEVTLESEKLKNFVATMREKYDVIILDCPPVTVATDAVIISRLADGVIYVVSYNKVKKSDCRASLKELKQSGANVIGTVFTQFRGKANGYYSYHYKRYYNEEGNK